MVITVKSNIKRVRRKIDRAFKRFPKEMDATVKNAASKVSGEVKEKTPEQTGSLFGSIRSKKLSLGRYIVRSFNKYGRGSLPEKYVKVIEKGRGNRDRTNQKNSRASKGSNGGYHMFRDSEKRAEKWLRVLLIKRLKRIARSI